MIPVNNCLIIDTETNGNQETQTVLEIGAVLYSVKYQTTLSCGSSLIAVDSNTENAALTINKINIEATQEAVEQQSCFQQWLQSAYQVSDVIVAHYAEFDKSNIISLPWAKNWDKPWLCTYQDFELFGDAYPGKKDLISLAQFYGVGISISHRAINDCLLLAEVFNRVPKLAEQFQIAQLPIIEAIHPKSDESLKLKGFMWDYERQGWFKKDKAESFDFPIIKATNNRQLFRAFITYNDRQIAKDWGFIWNGERKAWERLLPPEAANKMPFKVIPMSLFDVDQ